MTTEAIADLPLDETPKRLLFGWWNTSLSPVGKNLECNARLDAAKSVVSSLLDDLGVDFLALGEVTSDDISSLKDACSSASLGIYDGTHRDGRLQFDTGAIYNLAKLNLIESKELIHMHGTRRLKLANHVIFQSKVDGSFLHVFVTHWPSRAFTEGNIPARKSNGWRLREKVNEIEKTSPSSLIVLLGDFNDEPFDESLASCLLATRDRGLASTGIYLYNPFWRHLADAPLHFHGQQIDGIMGTHFHKNGSETRWRTFDQILFSSAFLGMGNWHLDERLTVIFRDKSLVDSMCQGSGLFDHFPVIAAIENHQSKT